MKTFLKLVVLIAGLAAVCAALACWLQKDNAPEYISIDSDPDSI